MTRILNGNLRFERGQQREKCAMTLSFQANAGNLSLTKDPVAASAIRASLWPIFLLVL
jgi:hypothetical protein